MTSKPFDYNYFYKEGKTDTDAIASWLASSARLISQPPPVSGSPVPKRTGRLKGKARKEAKKAAMISAQADNAKSEKPITAAEWLPLARRIVASTNPKIEVPESVINALDRAIEARSKLSNHASSSHDGDTESVLSDSQHQHFIWVLREVRALLGKNLKQGSASESTSTEKPEALHSRQYEILGVEEPSEAFLNAPDITLPPRVARDAGGPVFNNPLAKELWNLVTALNVHLKPMEAFEEMNTKLLPLRNTVFETWTQYQRGSISLTTASLTTKVTFELGKEVIDSFLPRFGADGPIPVVYQMFWIYGCKDSSCLSESSRRKYGALLEQLACPAGGIVSVALADPEWAWELGINSMQAATDLMLTCERYLSGERITPITEPGYHDMKPSEKTFFDEKSFLDETLCTGVMLFGHCSEGFCRDDFCFLLPSWCAEVKDRNPPPFLLAFYGQLLLTIKRALGEDGLRTAFAEFKLRLQQMKAELSVFAKARGRLSKTVMEYAKQIQEIQEIIEELLDNRYQVYFQNNPWSCGGALHGLQRKMQRIGNEIADVTQSVMCMVQLYNALNQQKLINHPWKDMELFAGIMKNDVAFFGEQPETPEAIASRFRVSIGTGGSTRLEAARTRNKNRPAKAPKKLFRFLTNHHLPMLDHFIHSTIACEQEVSWTEDMLLRLVEQSKFVEIEVFKEGAQQIALIPNQIKVEGGKVKTYLLEGETSAQGAIRSFALRAEHEAQRVEFPIAGLHQSILELFGDIFEDTKPLLGVLCPSCYEDSPSDGTLPMLTTGCILATGNQEKLLRPTADAINKWLEKGNGGKISARYHLMNQWRAKNFVKNPEPRGSLNTEVAEVETGLGEGTTAKPGTDGPKGLVFWSLG